MRIPKKVSEIEIKYRNPKLVRSFQITQSADVIEILRQIWNKDLIAYQESFLAIFLNRGNFVIGYRWISHGGTNGTCVDAKHLFGVALKANSNSLILVHNHPSGNLRASQADINITRKLKAGGELLDISILDHLIIVPSFEYYSLADEGLI